MLIPCLCYAKFIIFENILGTFGYTDEEPINLTSHEVKLIKQYRNHPEIQDAVNKLLDV